MVRDIIDILDERSRRVLNAVVRSYIDRPDPVGSRFVTRKYSFGFSSFLFLGTGFSFQ